MAVTIDRALATDLTTRYLRPLTNYVRRQLLLYEALGFIHRGDLEPADIVAAVFLEAVARMEERPRDLSLYRWLRRIARQIIRREARRVRREERRTVSLWKPIGFSDDGEPLRLIDILPDPTAPPPEDELERRRLDYLLATLLSRLPDTWAEAFLLTVVDGLPVEEVAALEGITPEEVRRLVEQTRAFLRAALAQEYEEAAVAHPGEDLFQRLPGGSISPQEQQAMVERLVAAGTASPGPESSQSTA